MCRVPEEYPMRVRSVLTGVAALFAMSTAMTSISYADTFNLTSCHVTGGCGTQTVFGTVTLTQNGSNVDFVVTLLGGNRFVTTGAGADQLFLFNATGVVAGDNVNEATVHPADARPRAPGGESWR